MATTLAGVGTEVFYWPIFATQMLWVAITSLKRDAMPQLLRWQLWLCVLASPLFALAAYASRRPSYTQGKALPFLGQFLEFGFLFKPDPRVGLGPIAIAGSVILPFCGCLLLGLGLANKSKAESDAEVAQGPPTWLMLGTLVAVLAPMAAGTAIAYIRSWETSRRIMVTTAIPVALVFVDRMLLRYWPTVRRRGGPGVVLRGALALIGLVPRRHSDHNDHRYLTGRSALRLARVPSLYSLLDRDREPRFGGRGTAAAALAGMGLVVGAVSAHVASVNHYMEHRPKSPRDYKAPRRALEPRLQESDMILVRGNHWTTTPIFYYLNANRYHFVGKDYADQIPKRPNAPLGGDSRARADAVRYGFGRARSRSRRGDSGMGRAGDTLYAVRGESGGTRSRPPQSRQRGLQAPDGVELFGELNADEFLDRSWRQGLTRPAAASTVAISWREWK